MEMKGTNKRVGARLKRENRKKQSDSRSLTKRRGSDKVDDAKSEKRQRSGNLGGERKQMPGEG